MKRNIRSLKQGLILLCALLLCFSAAGCALFPSEQERFDRFVEGLPAEFITPDNYSLNLLFNDPQAYGFEEELYVLPYADKEDYEEATLLAEELLDELHGFEPDKLSEAQRLSYELIEDYLEFYMLTDDYYYLDNSYLGSFVGFQAQLPILLNEFKFNREGDLDSYFNILETAEDSFLAYAEIERERLENGAGLSQVILDAIIDQCEALAADEDLFLIESINEKIDAADFLSEEEKAENKAKNESLLENDFLRAYRSLGDALRGLEGRTDDRGLASLENGREYYEALLQQSTGTKMTVEEVRSYFEAHIEKYLDEFRAVVEQKPELYQKLLEGPVVYSSFTTAEENIEYLGEQMERHFPSIGRLNFQVTPVPESMREHSSPAAFVMNPIDAPMDTPESIYLNGDYYPELFLTIAHEGYPGHMYQSAYFRSLGLPAIHSIMSYNGYTEGWATYVENFAARYAPADNELAQLFQIDQQIGQMYIGLMDIGIHYDGWDRGRFAEEYRAVFGEGVSDEDCDFMYDVILETPTNYIQYHLTGALFEDLYDLAEAELGEDFSPVDLHKTMLDLGCVSFEILEERVDGYIASVKENAA